MMSDKGSSVFDKQMKLHIKGVSDPHLGSRPRGNEPSLPKQPSTSRLDGCEVKHAVSVLTRVWR